MLGSAGVGKSSICSQVLSSENLNTYDTVENNVEKEVVVRVDGEESRLVFVDHPSGDAEVNNFYVTQSFLFHIVKKHPKCTNA